jgi:hypothetical protein
VDNRSAINSEYVCKSKKLQIGRCSTPAYDFADSFLCPHGQNGQGKDNLKWTASQEQLWDDEQNLNRSVAGYSRSGSRVGVGQAFQPDGHVRLESLTYGEFAA